jgi:hypothetical protein
MIFPIRPACRLMGYQGYIRAFSEAPILLRFGATQHLGGWRITGE